MPKRDPTQALLDALRNPLRRSLLRRYLSSKEMLSPKELSDLESISRKLEMGRVEIVIFGEIDTGKSALINALVGHNGLARTSNTPGRTQELNYFVPGGFSGEGTDLPPMALVDMPGYGYASAPKEKVDDWTKLVFDYLKGRVTLKRVYVLIDARHGIKAKDEEA